MTKNGLPQNSLFCSTNHWTNLVFCDIIKMSAVNATVPTYIYLLLERMKDPRSDKARITVERQSGFPDSNLS
jgi:hypothetical protein